MVIMLRSRRRHAHSVITRNHRKRSTPPDSQAKALRKTIRFVRWSERTYPDSQSPSPHTKTYPKLRECPKPARAPLERQFHLLCECPPPLSLTLSPLCPFAEKSAATQ